MSKKETFSDSSNFKENNKNLVLAQQSLSNIIKTFQNNQLSINQYETAGMKPIYYMSFRLDNIQNVYPILFCFYGQIYRTKIWHIAGFVCKVLLHWLCFSSRMDL
jgi:hypothetical protein